MVSVDPIVWELEQGGILSIQIFEWLFLKTVIGFVIYSKVNSELSMICLNRSELNRDQFFQRLNQWIGIPVTECIEEIFFFYLQNRAVEPFGFLKN